MKRLFLMAKLFLMVAVLCGCDDEAAVSERVDRFLRQRNLMWISGVTIDEVPYVYAVDKETIEKHAVPNTFRPSQSESWERIHRLVQHELSRSEREGRPVILHSVEFWRTPVNTERTVWFYILYFQSADADDGTALLVPWVVLHTGERIHPIVLDDEEERAERDEDPKVVPVVTLPLVGEPELTLEKADSAN